MAGILEVHAYTGIPASTVGAGGETRTNFQRKSFYAKGLHWVFYFQNMAIRYRVSPDGINWSEPIPVTGTGFPDFFALHYDGFYIHYVCTHFSPPIWYQRGIPNSDGTISWSTDDQFIPGLQEFYTTDPNITSDSEGYPWVGCYGCDPPMDPWICKSGQNDGSWLSNAPGFPYRLNPDRSKFGVIPLSLNGGKVYALYLRSYSKYQYPDLLTAPMYGKLWDGAGWGEEEQASISHLSNEGFHLVSAIAAGDDIHAAFLKYETFDIIHVERKWGIGWGEERLVESDLPPSPIPSSPPIISYSEKTGRLYCFWVVGNAIYFSIFEYDAWGAPFIWQLEEEPVSGYIQSFYKDYGGLIGVHWHLPESKLIRYKYMIP